MMEIDLPPAPDLEHTPPPGTLHVYNVLKFVMPHAHSPHSAGKGEDTRVLGLGVVWMEFVGAGR
jgi:hypothetical protein